MKKSALLVVLYITYVSLLTFALVSYLVFIYFEFHSTFHFSGSPYILDLFSKAFAVFRPSVNLIFNIFSSIIQVINKNIK